jgi:hypothetical protein
LGKPGRTTDLPVGNERERQVSDTAKSAHVNTSIITADQRLTERRGVKALIVGPSGVGKTSLLRTIDPAKTLFLDAESGDLAVQDVPVDTVRINDWSAARDIACRIGGPNPSYAPTACYSQAHFEAIGGELDNLDKYETLFIDSITAVSRLSFRWSEQKPEAFSDRSGKKDTRGAYGLHAREMIAWLNQLQHARGLNVIFVAILEKVTDDFNVATWQLQMEGGKTGRELPGSSMKFSRCNSSTSAMANLFAHSCAPRRTSGIIPPKIAPSGSS